MGKTKRTFRKINKRNKNKSKKRVSKRSSRKIKGGKGTGVPHSGTVLRNNSSNETNVTSAIDPATSLELQYDENAAKYKEEGIRIRKRNMAIDAAEKAAAAAEKRAVAEREKERREEINRLRDCFKQKLLEDEFYKDPDESSSKTRTKDDILNHKYIIALKDFIEMAEYDEINESDYFPAVNGIIKENLTLSDAMDIFTKIYLKYPVIFKEITKC